MHIIQNNFLKRTKASENFVEKYLYWYNDLVLYTPKTKSKVKIVLSEHKTKTPVAGDKNRFQSQESL